MSLEDQLKRLNDNLEQLIPALGGALAPDTSATNATADPPEKPKAKPKTKKAKAKAEKPAESDKAESDTVDRPKVMNEIVEFIKGKIKGADDPKEVQALVTTVRKRYDVELVGDLPDDKLLPFLTDIQDTLA